MKKLFIIFLATGYCLAGSASEPATSWLMSPYGTLRCTKISAGTYKLRTVLQNGDRLVVPVNQVISYSLHGKVFNKLPIYKNGKQTGKMAFMELVNTYGDLTLYRYGRHKQGSVKHGETIYRYLLYRDDHLHLASDGIKLPVIPKRISLKYTVM